VKSWRASDLTGGFTLLEAVIALALMGIILGALATISSQWLPNWNRGIGRLQREEQLALALERLSLDLAAAEFIPLGGRTAAPLFEGRERSIIFVRTALSPNSQRGLEIVRIAEQPSERGPILVRMATPFRPLAGIELLPERLSDPVVLLRPPYRLAFAYAGASDATSPRTVGVRSGDPARDLTGVRNGSKRQQDPQQEWQQEWRQEWRQQTLLPRAVLLSVEDPQRTLAVATATLIQVQTPIRCLTAKSLVQCQSTQQQTPQQAERAADGSLTK
jgi:general secretion pathway protein J